jgi:hypothetical protein
MKTPGIIAMHAIICIDLTMIIMMSKNALMKREVIATTGDF